MILSGLISKVDKLDIGKLKTGSVDLSKLNDVVKSGAVKMKKYEELTKKLIVLILADLLKNDYNTKMTYIEDKIPNLATTTALNAKITEVKR